jgi:hypothetical protein
MYDRHIVPALKALAIAIPLCLILLLAAGAFTWRLAVVGIVIFVALWILLRGRTPRPHDSPPSPDEWWWNRWG